MDLAGRVAIVSGGGSGIGLACAERLKEEGATVATWDLVGGDIECDVTRTASIRAAMKITHSQFGPPTLHVASAGIPGPIASFEKVPIDEFDRTFAVNTRGVFLTLQSVAQEIIAANLSGSLIAISSVNGVIADPGIVAYSTSKAAIIHMVRVAALDLGKYGIRVNAIGPGPTNTPMAAIAARIPGYVESIKAATPLGQWGTPEMIADGVVNVMRSDWITGQAVMVDGGSSLATARGQSWSEGLRS